MARLVVRREDGAFWLLTGPWARLLSRVQADPAVAIVVDERDLVPGTVRQVIARGQAELVPFDGYPRPPQAGPLPGLDESRWDDRVPPLPARRPGRGAPPGCGCGPPG